MALYFAYGSNMNVTQMEVRCPGARPLGIAWLDGWRFRINPRGVATIVPAPRGRVYGVVWRASPACFAALDRHEGVALRRYRRRVVAVEDAHGRRFRTLTYVGINRRPGRPRRGYLDGRILPAARHWGLPGPYVAELRDWLSRGMIRPIRRRDPRQA